MNPESKNTGDPESIDEGIMVFGIEQFIRIKCNAVKYLWIFAEYACSRESG
jgi:hypothetical protein